MNSVNLMGRLGGDPEVRHSTSTAVAKYSLAVDKYEHGERKTQWFDCVTFGKGAEFAEKYLKKGSFVGVTGFLNEDRWTDKDGNKRRNVNIVVNEHTFGGAGSGQNSTGSPEVNKSSTETSGRKSGHSRADSDGFMPMPEDLDDLPFE